MIVANMWWFESSGLRVPFKDWVFKGRGFWLLSLIPFTVMSLSNQHPYSLFFSSGLRSPSLARAQVEVGNNANDYLASTDVVPFRLS